MSRVPLNSCPLRGSGSLGCGRPRWTPAKNASGHEGRARAACQQLRRRRCNVLADGFARWMILYLPSNMCRWDAFSWRHMAESDLYIWLSGNISESDLERAGGISPPEALPKLFKGKAENRFPFFKSSNVIKCDIILLSSWEAPKDGNHFIYR